jgi:single-stranded DNA-binding protein
MFNRTVVSGTVTRIKRFANRVILTLASFRHFDRPDRKCEATTYLSVVYLLAGRANIDVQQGAPVVVIGRLHYQTFEENGAKRRRAELFAEQILPLAVQPLDDVNLCTLLGRAGSVEVNQDASRVMISVGTHSGSGDRRVTHWHSVIGFGEWVQCAQRFIAKGDLVLVEGRIQTRSLPSPEGSSSSSGLATEIVITRQLRRHHRPSLENALPSQTDPEAPRGPASAATSEPEASSGVVA